MKQPLCKDCRYCKLEPPNHGLNSICKHPLSSVPHRPGVQVPNLVIGGTSEFSELRCMFMRMDAGRCDRDAKLFEARGKE